MKKPISKREIVDRRIEKLHEIRKDKRHELIVQKRIKKDNENFFHVENGQIQTSNQNNPQDDKILTLDQINELIDSIISTSNASLKLQNLSVLRKVLQRNQTTFVLPIEKISKVMTNILMHENNDQIQLEAAWCLTSK